MSVGLIALLDDIAGLAKVAAASLDDVAGQAAKVGTKTAGVLIDDAAVSPRYVTGFKPHRELPIVWRITLGSLKNKLVFLLPIALLLGYFAPWLITPLLMLGGLYLSYEGAEKVYGTLFPHQAHAHEAKLTGAKTDPKALEDQKVASAVKTDFILSAEIMAITLAGLPQGGLIMQAAVLALVAVGITAVVYGGVALIVKADDVGLAMAKSDTPSAFGSVIRSIGRGLVVGMPVFLKMLAVVGTAAMIWVGGGIIVHGLEEFGFTTIGHAIESGAEATVHAIGEMGGFVHWLVTAAGSGVVGLVIGAILIPVVGTIVAPLWNAMNGKKDAAAH